MQIVIDINENDYKTLMINGGNCSVSMAERIIDSVYQGKKLPKGHGRLIDADAVLEEPIGNTYKDIDIAETIIEADAKSEGKELKDEKL